MRELLGQISWRNHIFTLAQFAGSLVLLILALFYFFDKQAALSIARADLDAQVYANDEAEISSYVLDEYLDQYRALQARGYIGSPQRLQWLETLRKLSEEYQIPGIEFTLEGGEVIQQNMDPYWNPDVGIRATNMKIVMQLSHEGDLYRLLSGLREQAPGIYNVEHCQLRWLEQFSEELALTRLRGECQLRWYTLVDITASWEQDNI